VPASLDPIREKLKKQWPDVHTNGPKDDFWKHEWSKHGTCAMQLQDLNTELKYFSKGITEGGLLISPAIRVS
jgi:ribonuclease T2